MSRWWTRWALARGAPARFDAAALLLLDQIGKLKDGKITLTDTKVNLAGMARELGGREAIAAALKNLPEGYSVAANDIKAPPYVFQAYKDPVALTLTLTGYVPDNNVHAALAAAAGHKFFSEKVVDNLKASLGAPLGLCRGGGRRRSARCRGCRPARLWYRTARSSCRAMRSTMPRPARSATGSARFSAGLAIQGRGHGQARGGASRCHGVPAIVRRHLGKGRIRFESGKADIVFGFSGPARSPDRDRDALPESANYRDRRPYRQRRRRGRPTRRCPESARRR